MRPRRLAAALALLVLAAAPGARAAGSGPLQARSSVRPAQVRIGEPATYRGQVIFPAPSPRIRWLPPESGEAFTWGEPAPRRIPGRSGGAGSGRRDTLEIEIPLQAFRIGELSVPGLRFQVEDARRPWVGRLPVVRLQVVSVLSAADSNADLRPLRGPIGAPWWERVPWTRVVGVLLALAAILALIVAWRRRRPRPAPAVAPVTDPATAALSELAALRRLKLPEHGRHAEHAFHLSRIARRFLEAVAGTPQPGDTTPELLDHLGSAALDAEELGRLEMLLRAWDRVKFARAPSSVEEAHSSEYTVEQLIRRRAAPPMERVA